MGSLSVLAAGSLSFFFGYHTMMAAWPWFLIHLQSALLFLTVAFGLVCLSLGVAIEVSSAGALTLAAFILFAGQWLTLGLDEVRVRSEGDFRIALEIISFCLPQYRFADLTDRIVYQWGALTFPTFLILFSYFLLWSFLLILTVWQNFQPHRQKHRKATYAAIAVASLGVLGLSNLVLWNPTPQLSNWRQQEMTFGFNPLSAKETGVGEVVTDILIRQIDVSWHGGGQPWSHYLAKASLCDFLSRRYRELTTHPFTPTRAELFHNRERSEALVRLAFDLSPSNVQAYQAYFHLLSLPSLTGEMIPPTGDKPEDHEEESAAIVLPPSEKAQEEMRRISFLALKNTDLTNPQQGLAAAWVWFNLLNITPKFQTEERRQLARHMLETLEKADAAWNAGRPVPAGYDFKRDRAFLGKLASSAIKNAKE
ncbi:MAG: hypothetical protein PW734_01190 [Verrucomicrobium sp.]|nr:hypothetical protein [Verrucomicrobium sp.]